MPAQIRSRTLANGSRRHDVQYRRGGRGYRLEHAGTFNTLREATIRKTLVEDWLAAGRDPRHELDVLAGPQALELPFSTMAEDWLATRVDLDDSTVANYRSHIRQVEKQFGKLPVSTIEPADVSGWIVKMIGDGLNPGTIRGYVGLLRMILDQLDDNPARHRSVRLPKYVRAIREPPDADEYLAMLDALKHRYRAAAVLMEQTGLRISEAIGMEERDIDREGLRVRVRPEVAKRNRARWIPVQPWYVDVVAPLKNVDRSSCAGAMHEVSRIHPHLLRHRRATLWHQSGLVTVELMERLGHSNSAESIDTYSHVRTLHEAPPSRILEVLREEG